MSTVENAAAAFIGNAAAFFFLDISERKSFASNLCRYFKGEETWLPAKGRRKPFLVHLGNAGHGIMKENRHISSRTGDRRVCYLYGLYYGLFVVAACCQPVEPGRALAERLSFCGGMGALASVLEGWIVTLYESGQIDAAVERLLRIVQRGCLWMSYYGMPYAFLCFGGNVQLAGFTCGHYGRRLPVFRGAAGKHAGSADCR